MSRRGYGVYWGRRIRFHTLKRRIRGAILRCCCARFGHVRLSTLPATCAQRLVLLASCSVFRWDRTSGIRRVLVTYVYCTLLSDRTACFARTCNPSPPFSVGIGRAEFGAFWSRTSIVRSRRGNRAFLVLLCFSLG